MKTKFYSLRDISLFALIPKLFFLISVSFVIANTGYSQSTALSFTAIPYSDPDFNAPGRGVEQWHGGNEVNVPNASTNTARIDKYYRFSWNHFETTQGVYTWATFDGQINAAIDGGQKFGFGVMTCCPGCESGWNVSFAGGSSAYPLYLHNLMQAEAVKDWKTGDNDWIPNWNSDAYLTRLQALNQAINAHIENTTYKGVRYKDIINYVDIRGYGAWGEWHSGGGIVNNDVSEYPAGTRATVASLKRIVDIHTSSYPNYPLVAMIAAFDANYLGIIMNPPEIAQYVLTQRNNWGLIGWRRDSWGATDSYLSALLENNTRSFGGMRFDTAILNRYKYAPIVGEPPGWVVTYNELESQVRLYHVSSFGNSNYGGASPTTIGNNIRAASKAAGYRITIEGGNAPASIVTGTPFNLTLNWKNVGIAPVYENWNTVYELKNASNVTVWSGTSNFKVKHFLPQASNTPFTDNFTLSNSVAAGTYKLVVSVKDPNGYRQPLPIAIQGRNTDGTYTLLNAVTVSPGGGPVNTPPTARAGADQTATIPVPLLSLNASASSDADGSITGYQWQQISGPGTSVLSALTSAITNVTGLLVAGDYFYKLTVTDNQGATGNDTVKITVNAALPTNAAPVANAGTNQTITLPTSTATLNGSASSDADGTVAGYLWQQVTGPSTSAFSSTTTASVTVSGLVAGVYTYRLTVTDDDGATNSATVTVTVNPVANVPPVANAGTNQTITLPTNSATLTGSASSDADGTITSYQWAQVSGPNTATFSSTTAAVVTVSGQIAGVYTYRLTVRDNSNATNAATVTVTVNAAANVAPVANAGTNQTITLPTNSATLNGSASSDPDGSIAGYQWQQVSGPNTSTISAPTGVSTTVSNLVAGVYTYRLTVTDNRGGTNAVTVTVTVNPAANQAPVANAGANQTITLPTNTASLTGSASSDPDGSIASYLWQQVSGPNTSTLSSTTAATITVSNLVAGVYTYRLTVTDNNGATNAVTVTVTVNAAANVAPVANAGANQTITLPTNTASLIGSASTDPDGTIASYLWQQVSGPNTSTLSSTTAASITVSNLVAGVYTYRLTVTDNRGATNSVTVTVTVNAAANNSPVANAGSNQTITLPTNSATLNGSASYDPDGTIAGYQWQQVSGPSTSTISAPTAVSTTVSNLVAGVYTYRLTVQDNNNATGTITVTVTVNAATNVPPVANAGAGQTITLPTNSATLNGGASSDADGTISSYAWQQVSGPSTSTFSSTTASVVTVSGLQVGVYTYRLTVRDNNGATATATVTVIVNAASNNSPVANAGLNQTISSPVNSVTLNGTGSYDPDGVIAVYLWERVSGPGTPTFSSTSASSITVSGLVAGVYTFRLTVTDNSGARGVATVTVSVTANFRNYSGAMVLYPNPATGPVNLVFKNDPAGTVTITVYDMNRRIVIPATQVIKPQGIFTTVINTSGLTSGAYIVEARMGRNTKMACKFVKR